MFIEWWLPLVGFMWISCITPGPNNMLLTASGARFGLRPTLPHLFGIIAGMAVMLLAVSLGLGELFRQWPVLQLLLKISGSAYLIWLSAMIFTAPPPRLDSGDQARPFTLWQGLAFQFVNPKAWLMAISGIASFAANGSGYWLSVVWIVLSFCLICLKTGLIWSQCGVALGRWFATPLAWRRFNRVMGILTLLCVITIWL